MSSPPLSSLIHTDPLVTPSKVEQASSSTEGAEFGVLCDTFYGTFDQLLQDQKRLNDSINRYSAAILTPDQCEDLFVLIQSKRILVKDLKAQLEEQYPALMKDKTLNAMEETQGASLSENLALRLSSYKACRQKVLSENKSVILSWQDKLKISYLQTLVEIENNKILDADEVNEALKDQSARVESAYIKNSQQEGAHPYSLFSYEPCRGVRLAPEAPHQKSTNNNPYYKSSSETIDIYEVGICEMQGGRPSMEDAILTDAITVEIPGQQEYLIPLLGVFDGHGPVKSKNGAKASAYMRNHLKDKLQEKLKFFLGLEGRNELSDAVIYNALKAALVSLHWAYPHLTGGTTANVSLIVGENLYTANIGDSRAVLARNAPTSEDFKTQPSGLQLSEDAKPNDSRHQKIIEDSGGIVVLSGSIFRVNGRLAAASGIGDHDSPGINPTVDITKTPLPMEGGWYFAGCDGVWDVVTSEKAIQNLSHLHHMGDISAEDLAKNMAFSAFSTCLIWDPRRSDNISVIALKIPPIEVKNNYKRNPFPILSSKIQKRTKI